MAIYNNFLIKKHKLLLYQLDIGLPVEIKKCFHADTSELFCVCGKLYIYSTNYINGFVLTNYEYRIGQPNYQFLTLFKMLVKIQYGSIGRNSLKTTVQSRCIKWFRFQKDRISGSREIRFLLIFNMAAIIQYDSRRPKSSKMIQFLNVNQKIYTYSKL